MEIQKSRMSLPFLPEDLILFDILPRLPIKSIFRFKSVSKKWSNFISNDPIFANNQSQRCLETSSCVMSKESSFSSIEFISTTTGPNLVGVPDPSLSFLGHLRTLWASSNGLLCGYCMPSPLFNMRDVTFFVCNPVTKDYVYIQDPINQPKFFGFAFDPSICTSNYEIICLYRTDGAPLTKFIPNNIQCEVGFEVFSSKTRDWCTSKANVFLSSQHMKFNYMSIFTGGKLYWRVTRDIVWFDPREDRAGLVSFPGEKKLESEVEIGQCDGGLSYSMITDSDIEIWVMQEEGRGDSRQFEWRKKYCVRLERIFQENWKVMTPFYHIMKRRSRSAWDVLMGRYKVRPLPFGGGDVLLFKVNEDFLKHPLNAQENIFKYNMKTGELELSHKSSRCAERYLYNNSLVSIPK